MANILLIFINLFVTVFNILLLIRVVSSWVMPGRTNPILQLVHELTEPVLAPVRKLLPSGGMIDISPLVAFFLLQGVQIFANRLLAGA